MGLSKKASVKTKKRAMDSSEKLAESYLLHLGYKNIAFEPDGNIPPDFLVDGRIAVEVRRLNQTYNTGKGNEGLEETAIPLRHRIKKLIESLGPPMPSGSWYVSYSFSRPVGSWKNLRPKIHDALKNFMRNPAHTRAEWDIQAGFKLEVWPTPKTYPTFYVIGMQVDEESGGFLLGEMAKNLQLCIAEKMHKTSPMREKYPEWWLVLADHIGYGLDEFERSLLPDHIKIEHSWQKIVLIDPLDHTHAFEIK